MAAAAYTTDLTDIDTAETNGTYTNIGTGADAQETDYFIQGSACVSKPFNITAGGIYHNEGAAITFATDECYWLWTYFGAPNALLSETAGGMQAFVGSSGTAYRLWDLYGSDNYTYGGWRCYPVDVVNVAADDTVGAPTGTRQYFGCYARTSVGIGKGNPLGLDVMRKGRGEHRYANGDLANGYATFAGFEAVNSAQSARWGLCQFEDGSYRIQGMIVLGYVNPVDFRDSNKNLVWNNTKKVTSGFNRIEVRQAGSRVDWTNINITALGTVARGNFECIANADVNLDTCVFTDMGTFIFQSASTIDTCTFRRCDQVTAGGAAFTDCTFSRTTAASAVSATTLNIFDNCQFTSDGSSHAVNLGTIAATTAMNWNNFASGYAATNGSTGNETILVNVASGQTLTINVGAGYTTPTYYNTGAGTVTVVSGQVTTEITVIDVVTGLPLQNARVYLTATGGGPLSDGTVIFNTLTDVNGQVSDIRSLAANQQVTGWVRKSTSAPFYKNSPITGTISNATGLSLTVQMIPDE